jgi:hypothetical protein
MPDNDPASRRKSGLDSSDNYMILPQHTSTWASASSSSVSVPPHTPHPQYTPLPQPTPPPSAIRPYQPLQEQYLDRIPRDLLNTDKDGSLLRRLRVHGKRWQNEERWALMARQWRKGTLFQCPVLRPRSPDLILRTCSRLLRYQQQPTFLRANCRRGIPSRPVDYLSMQVSSNMAFPHSPSELFLFREHPQPSV